jgi:hypothetical protein
MSRCRGRGGGLRCAARDKRRDGHEHREQGEVSFHHNCFAALRISGRISLPVAPSAVRPLTPDTVDLGPGQYPYRDGPIQTK